MRRIAIINQKGGVGKTTTTASLGAALAERGRRVVVVDMDAQANLALSFGVEAPSGSPTSHTVLLGETPFARAVQPTALANLSLVPSNLDLSGAELELASTIGREFLLRDALKQWQEDAQRATGRSPADYVLFDCPPSLGLLSINALAAAGEVLITIQTEFLALQGMSKLVDVVQLLRRRLNPELVITGILPCLYDSRLKLAREVLGEIRRYFPGQVLRQPIRANVKLAEAPSFGQTIFQYAPDSNGAEDYRAAASEVIAQEHRDPELAAASAPAKSVDASPKHEPSAPKLAPVVPEQATPAKHESPVIVAAKKAKVRGAPTGARAVPAPPSKPETSESQDAPAPKRSSKRARPEPREKTVEIQPVPRAESKAHVARAKPARAAEPESKPVAPHPKPEEPRAKHDAPAAERASTPAAPMREISSTAHVRARISEIRAAAARRVLRAEDLPALPPDAFEILSAGPDR